ncbi:MAG: hypothetical protein WAX69_24665 [Victivallales bacterium]
MAGVMAVAQILLAEKQQGLLTKKCNGSVFPASVTGLLPGMPPTWWHPFNRAGKLPAFRSCKQERLSHYGKREDSERERKALEILDNFKTIRESQTEYKTARKMSACQED